MSTGVPLNSVKTSNDPSGMAQMSKTINTTNQGVKFGRALFSDGNTNISPAQITAILKAAGLKVPPGVTISLDVAQMLVSGAAIYTGVQDYEDVSDLDDIVSSGASGTHAAVDLASQCGWVDKNNPMIELISIGADVAMIFSSYGTNVLAWVSLAMDLYGVYGNMASSDEARAASAAKNAVMSAYNAIVKPESIAAAKVAKIYQESANLQAGDPNKMSVFGYVGEMAKVAPDLFPNYFPQYSCFFPTQTETITANSSASSSFAGINLDTKDASFSKSWVRLAQLSDDDIRHYVFQSMLYPIVYPFLVAEQYYIGQNKASFFTMCLLAMFQHNIPYIIPGVDYSAMLDKSGFSPNDVNEVFLQNYLKNFPDPSATIVNTSAITGLGTAKASATTAQAQAQFLFDNKQSFLYADKAGRMDWLRTSPLVTAQLKNAFTFEEIPYNSALGQWNETIPNAALDQGGNLTNVFARNSGAASWRDPRNYWSCLSLLNTFKNDPFFKNWNSNGKFGDWLTQQFDFMGDIETLSAMHQKLQMKQMIRSINVLAKANIANFFGTTSDKITKIDKGDGSPVTYVRKA